MWKLVVDQLEFTTKKHKALCLNILDSQEEEAQAQFGFLLSAFQYGAPPNWNAFGFDRLCAIFGGSETIENYIAFQKTLKEEDVMIDSPAPIHDKQFKKLGIKPA